MTARILEHQTTFFCFRCH